MKNNIMLDNHIQGSGQSQVGYPSFACAVREAEEQIEIECFDSEYAAQAHEICLIIAEVFMLPMDAQIQIARHKLSAALVCGVYRLIQHEDVIAVMDGIEKATYEIKHKKTYLRTALYNSVFERETRAINERRICEGNGGYLGTRREYIDYRRQKDAKAYLSEQDRKKRGEE